MDQKEKGKNGKRNIYIIFFAAFCTVVILAFAGWFYFASQPKAVTIATIDKTNISSDEFQYFLSQNVSNALQQKTDSTMDDSTFLNSSYGSSTIFEIIKQQTLQQVLQMKLLVLKANKEGFKVSGDELNSEWKTFENTLKQNATYYGKSLKEFVKGALGVNLGPAEKIYKEYILSQKYFEASAGKIAVDQTKLAEYYKTNKSNLDHATVRHILISCDKSADDATVAAKKKQAEDILQKVKNGDDFSTLAKTYSEDPGSKDNGGVYTIQPNGQMVPQFEDWTFSHKAGDVGIVKTDFGFHIMKLDSIFDTLESQKESVTKTYRDDEYQKTLTSDLSGSKYKINVDNEVYSSITY